MSCVSLAVLSSASLRDLCVQKLCFLCDPCDLCGETCDSPGMACGTRLIAPWESVRKLWNPWKESLFKGLGACQEYPCAPLILRSASGFEAVARSNFGKATRSAVAGVRSTLGRFYAVGLSRGANRLGRLSLSILEYWTIIYADSKCWQAASCSPLGIYTHRVARGDLHHRHADVADSSGSPTSPRSRPKNSVPE